MKSLIYCISDWLTDWFIIWFILPIFNFVDKLLHVIFSDRCAVDYCNIVCCCLLQLWGRGCSTVSAYFHSCKFKCYLVYVLDQTFSRFNFSKVVQISLILIYLSCICYNHNLKHRKIQIRVIWKFSHQEKFQPWHIQGQTMYLCM